MRLSLRDVMLLAFAIAPLLIAQPCMRAAPPAIAHRAVVNRVTPAYPELARRMHVFGQVVIRVSILADGSVSETHVESGHALLRRAAEEAVHRWRFAAETGPSESIVAVNFNTDSR